MNKEMLALFILVLGFGFVEFVVPKILRAIRKTKGEDEKPAKTIVVECDNENMTWHTGMPTLEGWYLIKLKNDSNWYRPDYYVTDYCSNPDGENGKMTWSNYENWNEYTMVGWRAIQIKLPIVEGCRCNNCIHCLYDENNN